MCCNQARELAKNPPHEKVAEAYRQSAECYENAAKAEAQGNRLVAESYSEAGDTYQKKADELAWPNLAQQIHQDLLNSYEQEALALIGLAQNTESAST